MILSLATVLRTHFNKISRDDAKECSNKITCWLSSHRGEIITYRPEEEWVFKYLKSEVGNVIGDSMILIPWQVFDTVFLGVSPPNKSLPEIKWLATLPGMESFESDKSVEIGLYIDSVAELFLRSQKELILSNPYWSISAVIKLINRLHSWRPNKDLKFYLITRNDLSKDEKNAVSCLVDFLANKKVEFFLVDSEQSTQGIIHAKFILVDAEEILLGSTNLTHNGLAQNFELSVNIKSSRFVKNVHEVIKRAFY